MANLCYTIGHDDRSLKDFIDILKEYNINCIIDVRKNLISLGEGQKEYSMDKLKAHLNKLGIYYIPMNKELGLSSEDKENYKTFDEVRMENKFKEGIERIESGLKKGFNIAIMGVEKKPLNCNRGILIAYALRKKGVKLRHIVDKEITITQVDIEEELLKKYGVKLIKKVAELSIKSIKEHIELDMDEKDFKNEMIEEAYRIRYKEISENCCKL